MINSAVCRITLAALLVLSAGISTVETQAIDAGAIFRVFLKTGQALPTYGESAIVGNRVVFTLLVGSAEARAAMQLMSLPAERVDLVRTRRYADAMRARHYAATRGEVDYAAMTQEVQRTLAQLTSVADPEEASRTCPGGEEPAPGLGDRHVRLSRGRSSRADGPL